MRFLTFDEVLDEVLILSEVLARDLIEILILEQYHCDSQ